MIAIANIEEAILADLKTALEQATEEGAAIFGTVNVASSVEQAAETQMTGDLPVAVVIPIGTMETDTVEHVKACLLELQVRIMAKHSDGRERTVASAEASRLIGAARNAIENDPPDESTAWGMEGYYHDALLWGVAQISRPTEAERQPWIIIEQPLTVGFVIESGTAH